MFMITFKRFFVHYLWGPCGYQVSLLVPSPASDSQGGQGQFQGTHGAPGFSACSVTCLRAHLMVVGGSSRGPWGLQVSLLVPSPFSEHLMLVGGSSRGPWEHQVSLLVASPFSELISRWSEAAPGAPCGTRFLCLFLHVFQSSSHGDRRQFQGPLGAPGFFACSFTCFRALL